MVGLLKRRELDKQAPTLAAKGKELFERPGALLLRTLRKYRCA
jgi:hypothetical protein